MINQMKKLIVLVNIMMIISTLHAQQTDPVHWHFSNKKINDNTYELHFTANIDTQWHIYAQDNPEDLGLPTTISFNNNSQTDLVGKIKEVGSLIEKKGDSGLVVKYYSNKIDFVQMLNVKTNEKLIISGVVKFMACTDTHCLPEAQRRFSIVINEH